MTQAGIDLLRRGWSRARDDSHAGGFPIYRNRHGWPVWWHRFAEAWSIVTGKWSLHRAWQAGYDYGTRMEYHRTVIMGGR